MRNLVILLFFALALGSCETIVAVDTPPHTPRLALSYTLSNQVPTAEYRQFFGRRNMLVSASQGVLEVKGLAGRADAIVELLDETGQVVEQFRSKPRPGYRYGSEPNQTDSLLGYYMPVRGFAGEPGSTYTLRASAPDLETVESTLTLPAVPIIEAGSFTTSQTYQTYPRNQPGRLTCSVLDNAATTDYYVAYGRVLDRNGQFWGDVRPEYNNSGVDGPEVKLNRFELSNAYSYRQAPFSDADGNGQRLTINADVILQYRGSYNSGNPSVPEPGYVEIIVSSITPDTYRFYQSLQRYYDTDGNPFAEPAPLHSNVRPGYGLFGGATDVTYRIPL